MKLSFDLQNFDIFQNKRMTNKGNDLGTHQVCGYPLL